MRLVGFIIIIYHDARSPERQISQCGILASSHNSEHTSALVILKNYVFFHDIEFFYRSSAFVINVESKSWSRRIQVPRKVIVKMF